MNKVRWGVLSTAGIGLRQVLPAMQQGECYDIAAALAKLASGELETGIDPLTGNER
jgi:hypothetical protein